LNAYKKTPFKTEKSARREESSQKKSNLFKAENNFKVQTFLSRKREKFVVKSFKALSKTDGDKMAETGFSS
jgi:hypothetical protein